VIPWITYSDAITEALRVEMRLDHTVLCLIGASNGSRRPTDELQREFGPSRVREHGGAPSVLAAAAAAASEGMRPVCELNLGDLGDADADADGLAEAASSGPLVLRLVSGGDPGAERAAGWKALLAAAPNLKLVSPATASDAKGLLISAIRDPDPVCFVESRDLYTVSDGVPEGDHTVRLGEARLVSQGTEIVVLTHGAGAVAARQATEKMPGEIGLMDLRTLRPLDGEAIVECVRETGKVLIVEQPGAATGLAADLVEVINDGALEFLDAPIRELGIDAGATGPNGDWPENVEEACRELVAF
jgi:pyruvate/2-oxoglutarate/acetoin dehydrogenase E1 component